MYDCSLQLHSKSEFNYMLLYVFSNVEIMLLVSYKLKMCTLGYYLKIVLRRVC